jgi:hypothetical protein
MLRELDSIDYTAIATAFIAVFNFFLTFVTLYQVRLTRKIFVATHRPKVIVHGLEHATDSDVKPRIGVQLHYVNIGDTAAKVVEIGSKIIPAAGVPKPGIDIPAQRLRKRWLGGGEFREFPIYSDMTDHELIVEHMREVRDFPAVQLFCVGYILYEDMDGRSRKTGFCRRYDADTRTWAKVESPYYEYAY